MELTEIKRQLSRSNRTGYYEWLKKLSLDDHQYEFVVSFILSTELSDLQHFFHKNLISCISFDEIQELIKKAKIERSYTRFAREIPGRLRFIENLDFNKKEKIGILYDKLSKRHDKYNFISGISFYNSFEELFIHLEYFLQCVDDDYDGILKTLKSNDIPVLYSDSSSGVIIAESLSYKHINIMSGDTKWCIRRQDTYRSYVSDIDNQYVLFRTKEVYESQRKIGFTVSHNGSIKHCFNKTNSPYPVHLFISNLPTSFRYDKGIMIEKIEELNALIEYRLETLGFWKRVFKPYDDEFMSKILRISNGSYELYEYIRSDSFRKYINGSYINWFNKVDFDKFKETNSLLEFLLRTFL